MLPRLLGILAVLNAAVPQDPPGLNLRETRLATIPEGVTFKPMAPLGHSDFTDAVFSPDGRAVLYPASRQNTHFMMTGDVQGPDLSKVLAPAWSPDGRSWAYTATDRNEIYIVTGARILGKGMRYEWMGNPVFSPNGSLIAYRAGTRSKQVMIVGARDLGKDFNTVLGDPVFSPDGSKVAYRAQLKKSGKDIDTVALDDGPAPGVDQGYEGVKHIVFSPDGKRLAFVAETQKPLSREFVVCDGKAGATFGQIQKPVFSRDGSRIAYAAYEKGRWHPVIDGKRGPDFDSMGGLRFSPDGSEVAFWARKGFDGPAFVVKGEWRSDGFPHVLWGPVYSPDGRKVAFGAGEGPHTRKEFVVVGRERGPVFDEVWSPTFSADGTKVVFGARLGRELWWKVLDVLN